nr:MAG TPA_asm: hypothetical protein [Caudoviricetes sp.]
MSNERERLAREWATSTLPKGDAKTMAAIEHILATTTEPTMADVEWDWDKHLLAGATLEADGETLEAIMIEFDDGFISYVTLNGERGFAYAEALTPNGKRYKLVEVTGDEHPETLTTLEDYENAPLGTVVEGAGKLPWTRLEYIWKETAGDVKNDAGMAGTERRVLRRGWGE